MLGGEHFILWIAQRLAGYIQRGSLRNAAVGLFFGLLVAWTTVYILWAVGILVSWVRIGIIFSLVSGYVGAVAGSHVRDQPELRLLPREPICVWNLNQALAPLVAILIVGGSAVAGFWAAADSLPRTQAAWLATVIVAVALVVFLRSVTYGAQIGQNIKIFKLPRSKVYQAVQIRRWGFEVARGQFVNDAERGLGPLVIQFDDGTSFRCEISLTGARRVAAAMRALS